MMLIRNCLLVCSCLPGDLRKSFAGVKLLVSHNNFPGQFRRLVPAWASQGHDCFP